MGLGRRCPTVRRCHRHRDVDQPAEQYRISAQRISSSSLLSTTTISILKLTHTKGNSSSSTWLFNVTSHPLALSLLLTDFSLLAKSINHVVVDYATDRHIGAIFLLYIKYSLDIYQKTVFFFLSLSSLWGECNDNKKKKRSSCSHSQMILLHLVQHQYHINSVYELLIYIWEIQERE
jgi:hypothetical protein